MFGIGRKKNTTSAAPAAPAAPMSMDSTSLPSWMTGEAPTPPPRKKKLRVDSGGQLARGSDKLA